MRYRSVRVAVMFCSEPECPEFTEDSKPEVAKGWSVLGTGAAQRHFCPKHAWRLDENVAMETRLR